MRSRRIERVNNEDGRPCHGPREETAQMDVFFKQSCLFGNQDCKWDAWADWSHCGDCNACGKDRTAQSIRYREILQDATGEGLACAGKFNETKPCGFEKPIDCRLGEWGEWTQCSATCGGGVRSALRRVIREANYGGQPCSGNIRISETCGIHKLCHEDVDCQLSEWGPWHGCDAAGATQMTRERRVETYAQGKGKKCHGPMTEMGGCDETDQSWCSFSEWTEWSTCPVACGGGQQTRTRHMKGDRNCIPLSRADLKEITGCNTDSCDQESKCQLSSWSEWSNCSQPCGEGLTTRSRAIDQAAQNGGTNCVAALKEMKDCTVKQCPVRDCVWAAWSHWSGCSCTCGGGLKRRNRVIAVAPREGGMACAASDKGQVAACNTEPCDACIDGKWDDWSTWSQCTSSCRPGYRWRHRSVARHNNDCGVPVLGPEEEYAMCEDLKDCRKDSDCVVSEWSMWNSCSCSCYGVTERTRRIIQLPTGRGERCNSTALREIAPCNPSADDEPTPPGCRGQGPQDCVFSIWEDWGDCSVPCGGGQRTRMRQILEPANHGGKPCGGELAEVKPCNEHHCPGKHCVDCRWGAWSAWGDCSSCLGQKYRQRTIEHLQNECGRKCAADRSKETMNCTGSCDSTAFCRWADWADLGGCSATCGTAVKLKQRRMEITHENGSDADWNTSAPDGATYLMTGPKDMVCSGEQTQTSECAAVSCDANCHPRNCRFGPWQDWSVPQCTQLCTRDRTINRRSSCGGKPCSGAQTETKHCARKSCVQPVDCVIGEWDDWSDCTHATQGQRIRQREILGQAQNGGKPCGNPQGEEALFLEETEPCPNFVTSNSKVNCILSEWNAWTACTALCGGGTKHRSRGLSQPPQGGGHPCQGSLEELIPCNEGNCSSGGAADCLMAPWAEWAHCDSHDQMTRHRKVAQEPSKYGLPCNGSLSEVVPCHIAVDCVLSPWTKWDKCDKSCDGGQQQRQRQVTLNPRNGGKACEPGLIETRGCNENPCSDKEVNCQISSWSMWSKCTTTCGPGTQIRKRQIKSRLSHCGAGCIGNMSEVKTCYLEHCGNCERCKWGEWKDWSECTRDCGGGQRHRLRNITVWPTPGCPACDPKPKAEIDVCNTAPCSQDQLCVDGKWDTWHDWEVCSTSCEGGMRWRDRKVLRPASSCGKEVEGDSREEEACNEGIPCKASQDCILGSWSVWTDCSSSCHGVKRRHRSIEQHGYGQGKYCEGTLEEAVPCALGLSSNLVNWDKPDLYLNMMNFVYNNLNGGGPGNTQEPPVMRVKNVAANAAQTVDLLIKSEDYNGGQGVIYNGKQGDFGNIFLPRESEATVEFELVDSTTSEPMAPNDFVLKFFDNDEGTDGSDMTTYEIESVGVCEEFYTSADTVFKPYGLCASPEPTIFEKPEVIDAGCTAGGFQYMNLGNVINSNLGGKGPNRGGQQNLHYQNVLNIDGTNVDLIMEVVEQGSSYETANPSANGKYGGATSYNKAASMGAINMLPGGKTKFIAKFIRSDGQAVYVPKLNLTFYDIDMPRDDLRERVLVNGYKTYFTVDASGKKTDGNSVAFKSIDNGGEFSSGRQKVPEPTNPAQLTNDQADVSVTLYFENVHEISFELEVTWIGQAAQNVNFKAGQIFFFGGSACGAPLPQGVRRLQIFNVPDFFGGGFSAPAPPSVAPAPPSTYRNKDIVQVSQRFDADKDNKLNFEEFSSMANELRREAQEGPASHSDLQTIFASTDTDNDGYVTYIEIDSSGNTRTLILQADNSGRQHATAQAPGIAPSPPPTLEVLAPAPPPPLVSIAGPAGPSHGASAACSSVPKPITTWSPTQILPDMERKTIAIRFSGKSKVTIKLKTGKGCGHNFLFAAKACLTGHCDPCGPQSTCVFQAWQEWGKCSERCDGGAQERKRTVSQGVMSSHGGGCDGAITAVRSCNTRSCNQNCEPVDCKWGKWAEWGACSKCGGQKQRVRKIVQLGDCGGRACDAGDALQIQKCPRRCHPMPYCVWTEWSPFGKCSVSCGCGRKKRTRDLKQINTPPPAVTQAYQKLDKLEDHVGSLRQKRLRTLALSFMAGPSMFLILFVAYRMWPRSRFGNTPPREASTLEMHERLTEHVDDPNLDAAL